MNIEETSGTVADWFRGDWFQTHTGVQFYPIDPRPEDINITDIAHGLSHVCRFGGHTREFYSVAQHSVIVSQIVPSELALVGLLHDASEAYLGDMVRPLKLSMPEYRRAEERLERVIAEVFGIAFPYPPEIKHADNVALMTERRDLLAVHRAWSWKVEPLAMPIVAWSPQLARRMFLARFKELT